MPEITLQSNGYSALLSTMGAQVLSWRNNSTPLLYEGSSVKRSGIPLLFPFADPLENNLFTLSGKAIGQHGFARNTEWSVYQSTATSVCFTLSDADVSEEIRLAYPFLFTLYLEFALIENKLVYSLTCKNRDTKEIPIMPGIHPYFPIQHAQKSTHILQDGEYNTQNINWECEMTGNYYPFSGSVISTHGDGKIQIIADREVFRYLVVWSQPPILPDSNFICLELFSGKTNQINSDPILVKPHQIWSSTITFSHTH